ncbi:hypothetical protein BCR32DRAFT_188459, partial [Anaeromyces robustus]
CKICNKVFNRKYDLQRHNKIHLGIKPYKCINCNKTFTRSDYLKRHLRNKTC